MILQRRDQKTTNERMLKKLIGRLYAYHFSYLVMYNFSYLMIEPGDKLIPIEVETEKDTEIWYMNESEYERNRLFYESRLIDFWNFRF